MVDSVVFARWCQCALPCGHISATWRTRLNSCFLWPTRVNNPNGKSISSAVFAQLRVECRRVHWCHLTNTIEFVLPSAHPSPQHKRQIHRCSCFCTAHSRKSLYFTMADPKNSPLLWGNLDPRLTRDSLGGPSEPTTQTASRSVQPFLHRCPQCPYTLQWDAPFPPKNCPFPWDIWTPI